MPTQMPLTTVQGFSHYPAWPAPAIVSGGRRVRLLTLPAHECSYLPGRVTQTRSFWAAGRMEDAAYQQLMDAGFRRSGRHVYQPACAGCRECVPIRVPAEPFRPSKSQRRCWRRNADLRIEIGPARLDEAGFALYQRYLRDWHGRSDTVEAGEYAQFLVDSPVNTVHVRYYLPSGELVALGICDVLNGLSLSSVYLVFDPALCDRGLGTFAALWELDYAKRCGIPYYYLGYWVASCRRMNYKCAFRPYEILRTDGMWSPPSSRGSSRDDAQYASGGRVGDTV